MYADVLVEVKSKNISRTFTYKVKEDQKQFCKVGVRVKVNFGSRFVEGFVLGIKDICNENYDIKEIDSIIDEKPVLNNEMLELGKYISNKTLCSLISSYEAMLPTALKAKYGTNINKKMQTYLVLNKNYDEAVILSKNELQREIVDMVASGEDITKSDAKQISASAVNTLIKNNIIKEVKEEVYRTKINVYKKENLNKLTSDQQKVLDGILKNKDSFNVSLIHGVTGSGKTEVYINIIKNVINDQKQAIMLVPEISLTPQFVNKFINHFGSRVAIFHSGLSYGEKYDEWRKIDEGKVDIVIGTRSALFVPFKDIGVIIIDEEHSDTYKQDSTPRYDSLDVALFRCKYHNCPLILGSATPKLISLAKAKKGLYNLYTLNKRVNNATLPICHIVDMKEEMKKKNPVISEMLKEKMTDRLNKNEQIILLLNRRGHSTFVSCPECGYTFKCPHCDITLTYHKTSNILRCHYCGYATYKFDKCPNCNNDDLNFMGLGTEKLMASIEKLFPTARVVRMDQDTTSKKGSHERIIKDFLEYKYDILLGTQMISKGLDFPKVSLVGIINADTSLNIPNYKANEDTFSLLYQTSGRAGRSEIKGEVIIQTYNPDNYTLKCVANNDYESFYKKEMDIRKKLKYPPYYYLTLIKIVSKDYEQAKIEAQKTVDYLRNNLNKESIVLGPGVSLLFRLNNVYRFQIIIKYRFDDKLYKTLNELQEIFSTNNKVNIEIDMSPNKI